MCTLSWLRTPTGYDVFFNRDERRARQPATPPVADRLRGVAFVAPRDGDAGGTWLLVNAFGTTVALLNGDPEGERAAAAPVVSRGSLVLDLADASSAAQMARRLSTRQLGSFHPFTLAVFERERLPTRFVWAEGQLRAAPLADVDVPLASSSLVPAAARRARARELRRLAAQGPLTPERLAEYHRSHRPARGPLSPCMHRADAETVSYATISVGRDAARFAYVPGPPCGDRAGEVCVGLKLEEQVIG
jgi:hypothetical protein